MMPDDLPDESDQLVVADNLARLQRFTPARIALRAGRLRTTDRDRPPVHARSCARATPFTLHLILRPSGNRFASATGASSMSGAPLAIGPSICVARTSGAAFRPQAVSPSTASYTETMSRSSPP